MGSLTDVLLGSGRILLGSVLGSVFQLWCGLLVNHTLEICIRLSIEDAVHCAEEGGSIRLESRCKVFGVKTQFRGVRGDLLEAGATFLHQVQLGEDIGNDGVSSLGRNLQDIPVLDHATFNGLRSLK